MLEDERERGRTMFSIDRKFWQRFQMMMTVGILMLFSSGVASGSLTLQRSGYQLSTFDTGAGVSGAIAFDTHGSLFVAQGGFQNNYLTRIVNGATSVYAYGPDYGGGTLTSRFGSISGIAIATRTGGEVNAGDIFIGDNYQGTDSSVGNTIFRLRDINSDGDALDTGEVTPFLPAGSLDTIADIEFAPGSATLWASDAPGNGQGKIYRINPDATFRSFYTGLDFGAGVAFDSQGRLYVGNATWADGTVDRYADLNGDGDFDDMGEITSLVNNLPGANFMVFDGNDDLFITGGNWGNSPVVEVKPDGSFSTLADDGSWTGALAFDDISLGFEPSVGAASLYIADSGSFLYVITPVPEPNTLLLLGSGLMGIMYYRKRGGKDNV